MADFAITGPIARADLPGLCERVCGLLERDPTPDSRCDVTGVEPDAVVVDALARLQLAALRRGCRVHLRGASAGLLDLVELMGLSNVLADPRIPRERGAEAEGRRRVDGAPPRALSRRTRPWRPPG
jgi:ABC-type transporter Mla MlaB component